MSDTPTQHAQMNFNDAYREFIPLYSDNANADMKALGMGLSQWQTASTNSAKAFEQYT